MKKIVCTVTNDLSYDQRMKRICNSLATNGYEVLLIGRKRKNSIPLNKEPFLQKRFNCWFDKGKLFYAEYNIRLFFYLLFSKMDAICAIDLDTILPCYFVSILRRKKRVYDAHEFFTGQKEIQSRPSILKIWSFIERIAVPKFRKGYAVNGSLVNAFKKLYGVEYEIISNMPILKTITEKKIPEKILLYQGAVNEGRGFEQLIPAMKLMECKLWICGDGNFMNQVKKLVVENNVQEKVFFKGMISPEDLWQIAQQCTVGISIPEATDINQYMGLPNKFFDNIHAGLPQVAVNYPEYRSINEKLEVAVLLADISPQEIAKAVNNLMDNDVLYNRLWQNCMSARNIFNWNTEEAKLLQFYKALFNH